ncbi:MAG: flippase [Neisseria sp.]|uniref:flippase n=1 Tax=Neisseria sp. TaxID=192066 RepID=UPI0026DBD905|nr:flippase [Neisseria sp.]MDO4641790.1 flippase [Neisseria sp.]
MKLSHIGWNMAGLALPLLIALFAIPQLISSIGNERFGLLALAWAMMTYAGILDLGIGRALTQMVSKLRGQQQTDQVPVVLATASRITMIAGLIGSVGIIVFNLLGGSSLVKTEHIPNIEIRNAIFLLAIVLPAQAMSATYRGMNEAYMNFKGISILRVFLGAINFAGPLAISYFTNDLAWIIASLVISRVASLFLFRYLAFACLKENEPGYQPNQLVYSTQTAKTLFSFGGWVTVSSILSPMMVQLDRFMIAALISASAVTIYVVPFELVAQSLILVSAITSVIFPSLSRLIQEQPEKWRSYFNTWLFRVGGMMLLVSASMAVLMPFVLKFWLKTNFNPESVLVGQILCVGVFLNSLSALFYSQLHARGKASITAKFHMIEFPIYFAFLYFALTKFGIAGAAVAWSARMTLDLSLLMLACQKTK